MELNRDMVEWEEIQNYIDRYHDLTPKQLHKKLAEQLTQSHGRDISLQYALEFLLEQTNPAPQKDPAETLAAFQASHLPPVIPRTSIRIKRALLVAAVITLFLILSITAFAIHHYGLFLNIQNEYTQPRTLPGPATLVSSWTDKPVPTYAPKGFSINDAGTGHGLQYIEYKNINNEAYYVYLYGPEAGIGLDTEDAAKSSFLLGDTTVYQVDKDGLCKLTWNINLTIAEIVFHSEEISIKDMKLVAESMVIPDNNG